jgi:spore maturation protein SpmB
MVLIRLGSAAVAGWIFSLVLPASLSELPLLGSVAGGARAAFWATLAAWGLSTGKLVLKIVLIVLAIMIAQRLLEEFKIMDLLSKIFAPLMKVFGLPASSSFLWIVINIVGYAYGAGIVTEQIQSGRMKPQEGDLFNHHAAVCHSLLEDTVIFLAIGIPLFWLTVPRLALAIVVVWLERFRRHYVRRSFRVGIS